MNELSAGLYGLLSALSWGSGDFSGGLASKRSGVITVVVISQFFGGLVILGMALIFEPSLPPLTDLALGGVAGVSGAIGLVALYQALASGRMRLAAPLTSVVSAIVPVSIGMSLEGLPSLRQGLGFGTALVAVWLVSQETSDSPSEAARKNLSAWIIPVIAGLGFGFFFILIDRVEIGAVFWPLAGARLASLVFLLITGALLGRLKTPGWRNLPLILLCGLLDVGGNVFFVLAAQTGRLDISVVLSSFYAAVTVLWAWLLLREKLNPGQWVGVIGAVLAVILITR